MQPGDEEEKLLREVALQNAQTILQARQRAEEELVRAKEALELKTQELASSLAMMRATLESTTDGILVTDASGQVNGFNQRFVEMWGLPPDVIGTRRHDQLVQFTSRHFANPARFLAGVADIYAAAPAESLDLLELADGRVFERFSRIQFLAERDVGRVWSFRDITERQRAEEALQKQSEWLRVTLTSIGDAVITTDTDGRVTSLNPVAEVLTGWTPSDACGLPLEQVFRIINEQTLEPVSNPALNALQEGRIVGLANHTVLVAKDGTRRAIDDSAAPIKDEDGTVLGVVLIFRDVTQQRQAEEARLHLAAVVDSSDDAIVTKSLDGIIFSWNEGARRIFGYTAEEVVGKPITILLPKERHYEEDEILGRLRRGERLDHFETVRVHKQGRRIEVSVTASPIRDSGGVIIGASKIARDITQRKRNEQTTRFLADASAVLAELSDYQSTLQKLAKLAVPVFADWCAVDMQEPGGSVSRLVVVPAEVDKTELARELDRRPAGHSGDIFGISNVLRTGEPQWAGDIQALLTERCGDGGDVRLLRDLSLRSFLCVPLRSRGKAIGALTFVTAESGREYDTDDLRAAEDLAHRAVIAIENANLLAALKESDQRKDEFLAMLAHELRNPLAPIRNSVQIFRAKASPEPELQWATEVIDRQVFQMTRLVDDLLDVSRITRGKIQLHTERLSVLAVVNSAVDASRPLIEKGAHQFTVTLPSEPIYLEADLTRLSQVLLNLLNNAAKYTDHGGRIWLTVEQEDGHVLIRVKDTGIGIPPEMLPRVFDMFTQVDRSLERSQGGLGIGLMLVQRLVEMHGGTVVAHSDGPGKGSEFVVRLPVAGQDKGQRPPDAGAAAAEELGIRPKRCILIVDDNRDAADSLGRLLRMRGHEVQIAHDGLEAVAAAAAFRPDLALLDIGLPKLNGYDAARRIRAAQGDAVALIAVTGWGQAADQRRSREAGFDHHLTKPVDLDALERLLSRTPTSKP